MSRYLKMFIVFFSYTYLSIINNFKFFIQIFSFLVSFLFSISKHKAITTELHLKVRQTCLHIVFKYHTDAILVSQIVIMKVHIWLVNLKLYWNSSTFQWILRIYLYYSFKSSIHQFSGEQTEAIHVNTGIREVPVSAIYCCVFLLLLSL